MIRVILDPNVFISFLLRPTGDSPPVQIIEGAFTARFRLVLPVSAIVELAATATSKPHLKERIDRSDVIALIDRLLRVSEQAPALEITPAPNTRDPEDDYLLAHAVLEQVDYLVSGDRDLLALREAVRFKIASPAEFVQILDELAAEE